MRGMTNLLVSSGSGPTPVLPDGKTITPINDVTIWQECAGLTPTYASLGEILSDSGYVNALMMSNNAVDYMVRSTDFAAGQTSLVPTMTSDTAPSGQCFCTSVNSSYAPYKAFDNNDSTNAVTSNGNVAASSPSWIGYMFTSPTTVGKAVIYQTSYTYTGCYIQYSNDGTTYYNASGSFTLGTTWQTIEFEPATGTYWRLYLGATTAATARPIYTIQFYSGSVVSSETAMTYIGLSNYASNTLLADTTWRAAICNSSYIESVLNVKVPTMTSNTAPSGVVSASSENPSGGQAYRAFDGDDSTLWGTSGSIATAWIQYEWSTPCTICKYSVLFNNTVQQNSFKISRSSDGTTFTDITETISTSVLSNVGNATKNVGQGTICRLTTNGNAGYGKYAKTIQFYGRQDV